MRPGPRPCSRVLPPPTPAVPNSSTCTSSPRHVPEGGFHLPGTPAPPGAASAASRSETRPRASPRGRGALHVHPGLPRAVSGGVREGFCRYLLDGHTCVHMLRHIAHPHTQHTAHSCVCTHVQMCVVCAQERMYVHARHPTLRSSPRKAAGPCSHYRHSTCSKPIRTAVPQTQGSLGRDASPRRVGLEFLFLFSLEIGHQMPAGPQGRSLFPLPDKQSRPSAQPAPWAPQPHPERGGGTS